MMNALDPRLTPARPDLAAAHLQGQVVAPRYVAGRPMHLAIECADLRRAPSRNSAIDTQVLYGEDLMLYEAEAGWAWVQLARDSYVGYLARDALAEGAAQATHKVAANRSFIYPRPDIKAPILAALPLGAAIKLIGIEGDFGRIADGGYVFARHLMRSDERADDFVAVAEGLLGTPYLWGGKSSLGLDCSGLVQLALAQAGINAPRDTDLQQQALGSALALKAASRDLRRGDLIFWKGHVGMMRDATTLLHANAHHMLVASEPLAVARARIGAKSGGEITAIKRF
ncbi:MAG: C40 family peptidase [Methylovirgula sp.]